MFSQSHYGWISATAIKAMGSCNNCVGRYQRTTTNHRHSSRETYSTQEASPGPCSRLGYLSTNYFLRECNNSTGHNAGDATLNFRSCCSCCWCCCCCCCCCCRCCRCCCRCCCCCCCCCCCW